jgi:hypothetical protein
MSSAALPADGDRRGMLAKDQDGLAAVARDVKMQPALQAEQMIEIKHPQQVNLEKRIRARPFMNFRRHAISTSLQKIPEFRCLGKPIFQEEGWFPAARRVQPFLV